MCWAVTISTQAHTHLYTQTPHVYTFHAHSCLTAGQEVLCFWQRSLKLLRVFPPCCCVLLCAVLCRVRAGLSLDPTDRLMRTRHKDAATAYAKQRDSEEREPASRFPFLSLSFSLSLSLSFSLSPLSLSFPLPHPLSRVCVPRGFFGR